ncbi:Similar to ORFRU8-L, Macaca mulatta rhadinovirus 26-95 [Macacine gammaherpesvirus 5]|nr:Similar to ORFRU8-L, Macaca mulatta rhadinovirus 26-95 [Macacine gammaherpesvirus 5]
MLFILLSVLFLAFGETLTLGETLGETTWVYYSLTAGPRLWSAPPKLPLK